MRIAIITAVLSLLAMPAFAQDCSPAKLGSFDLVQDANGDILIPATLNDVDKMVGLNFNGELNTLYTDTAAQLNLAAKRIEYFGGYLNMGDLTAMGTMMPSMVVGKSGGKNLPFMVQHRPPGMDDRIAAWFGLDISGNYDVDIDFPGKKVNLFAAGACDEKHTVYWTDSYSVVPLKMGGLEKGYVVPVQVDGHDAMFSLAVNRPGGTMDMTEAYKINVTPDSPGMQLIYKAGRHEFGQTRYRHTFKSLTLGGVAIANPVLDVVDNQQGPMANCSVCKSDVHGTLSLAQLQPLHLYISFKNMKMYVSQP